MKFELKEALARVFLRPHMPAKCITFDKKGNFFAFDGQYGYDGVVSVREDVTGKLFAAVCEPETGRYNELTPNVIGKIIAKALLKGVTVVKFEDCTVTVNYLVEMLCFTGRHGWFYDVFSHTEDPMGHVFMVV